MSHRLIELQEHQSEVPVALSELQAAEIAESRLGVTLKPLRDGRYAISSRSIVGSAAGRTWQMVVRPKLPLTRVFYLFTFAGEMMHFAEPVKMGSESDFLTSIRLQFAHALGRATAGGLLRDYRSRSANLSAVAGRIDHASLAFSRFGLFPPIPCTHDEYTIDSEANRRLLAAAVRLLKLDSTDETSERLLALLHRFDDVELVTYFPHEVGRLPRSYRLTALEPALSLAELILSNSALRLENGTVDTTAFAVDMNELFERFVVRILRRELRLTRFELRSHARDTTLHLDADGGYQMRPDAVWWYGQHANLVIDAKYKADKLPQSDVRQLVAYCTGLGINRGVFITAGSDRPDIVIRNSDIRISVRGLQLESPIDVIQANAKRVANDLRALRDQVVAGRQATPRRSEPTI